MVIHLGDLSAGVKGRYDLLTRIVNLLNGKRILIKGNHDHFPPAKYKQDMGFDEVYDYLVLGDVLFTHYPLETTQYSKPEERTWINGLKKVVKDNSIKHIVHGHTHQRNVDAPNHYNCSVELIDYRPIELGELLSSS